MTKGTSTKQLFFSSGWKVSGSAPGFTDVGKICFWSNSFSVNSLPDRYSIQHTKKITRFLKVFTTCICYSVKCPLFMTKIHPITFFPLHFMELWNSGLIEEFALAHKRSAIHILTALSKSHYRYKVLACILDISEAQKGPDSTVFTMLPKVYIALV